MRVVDMSNPEEMDRSNKCADCCSVIECDVCGPCPEHDNPGDKLHHVDGTHRSTPPTTGGRTLASHQAALERHVADGHTHEAPTHTTDTEGRTAEQFLAELFEFERCDECGGDAPDHEVIPIDLGAYGGPYFFARCKCEVAECVHCGHAISRRSEAEPWWHGDSQLPPCDPSKVDPEALTDTEADKYDIATPTPETAEEAPARTDGPAGDGRVDIVWIW